jgi:hypothetical protein
MMNYDELTLDEIEEMEMLLGTPIDESFGKGIPKGRPLKVLYYMMMKKQDPTFTFEQAGKVTQADVLKLMPQDSDPKEK